MTTPNSDIRIEIIDNEADIAQAFDSTCQTFGHQTKDAIWTAMNPGWDTPEGQAQGAERMAARWRTATKDRDGNPNTVFIKATAPDPQDPTRRALAGFAIWEQTSMVEGRGVPVLPLPREEMEKLYPGNEAEQRFLCQAMDSLHRHRGEVAREVASTASPSLMALDMCAVSPGFQRRGIAGKLVEWGLGEAERRGGMEAVTEASSMGRGVYLRHGFKQDGPEIVYEVDAEFASRDKPSNVFMRTGRQGV